MAQSYFIWWLNQQDLELIDMIDTWFPEYIEQELDSMNGRPLGGRLWINPDLTFKGSDKILSVDPWPDTDFADTLCKNYGGLVIREEDVLDIQHYPGLLTDFYLNIVLSK